MPVGSSVRLHVKLSHQIDHANLRQHPVPCGPSPLCLLFAPIIVISLSSPTKSTGTTPTEDTFRQLSQKVDREAPASVERILSEARASVAYTDDPGAFISAARCCKQLGKLEETLEILRRGLSRCAPSAALHEYYVERLEKCNRTEEAIAAARKAASLFPGDLIFPLREALLLPIFYESCEQLSRYRVRFTAGLRKIIETVPLSTPEECRRALTAVGQNLLNKYLPYQGENDLELQVLYGRWLHDVMASNFPEWVPPLAMPPVGDKIRVGYVSALSDRFVGTSAAKLFGGWLRGHDPAKFEIFGYHTGGSADLHDRSLRRSNVSFRKFSGDLGEIARSIRGDRLHALVYLDFVMHPMIAQLAALRLAPLQCMTWDTPVTTGIPTVDAFLSSELMEPPDGQANYSERLIKLPGVGVSFAKPVIPRTFLRKTRRDYGIREDGVVYLSSQSVFKFLPEQDELVARIAKQVSESQFVFLVTNELVGKDFRQRMERSFAAVGLRASERCVWLPEMDVLDYWNLHLVSDVFLDTTGWSAGVAAFEAVACELPIVTLPGTLMRSRHSCAILTQLGVTDTIARDARDYVAIAVRLGMDKRGREAVIDKMKAGVPSLYSDDRSLRALEDFFQREVRLRSQQA